jgi:Ca-activated chloride channel family protein
VNDGQGTLARRASPFLIVLAALPWWAASASQGQEPQVFRAQSNLVVLHVNVFDGKSDAVPNLPREVFHIVEDNVPQQVTFFTNEDIPVAVGLLIDNSSSMLTRRNMVSAGTDAFAASSHPEDQVFTMLFNEHVIPGLPPEMPFTRSPGMVQASLRKVAPGGKTAFHDAVIAGLSHIEQATHQKHVLIALSDGDDNASRYSEQQMFARAASSNALIYTISTAGLDPGVGNQRLLKRLAERTGGVTYQPKNEQDVVAAFGEIAANIRRGYSLGYVPTNSATDGRFRKVSVSVRGRGLKNLQVSARDGYVASDHVEPD